MNFKEVAHLYLGCKMHGQADTIWTLKSCDLTDMDEWYDYNKPILRQISSMTDDEIKECGKLICHSPNANVPLNIKISRTHNTVGANYYSEKFISGEYFSIWNEHDRPNVLGHTEHGWFSDTKKRENGGMKRRWKVGSYHLLTLYMLKKHFDLFSFIKSGEAFSETEMAVYINPEGI